LEILLPPAAFRIPIHRILPNGILSIGVFLVGCPGKSLWLRSAHLGERQEKWRGGYDGEPMVRQASLRKGPLALLVLALAWAVGVPAAPTPGMEYQVKAVFLFNFTQFVDWPAEAFARPDSPLIIGILGQDPFDTYLDDVVRGEKAGGHPIIVRRFRDIDSVRDCQLLFVGEADSRRPETVLAALRERTILTVGDSGDFSKRGGMIDFITRQGKIRLQINVETVRAARLTVSSKLLRLADIVNPGKG
jgi:hypothetical protein